jgi:hypothetical protein
MPASAVANATPSIGGNRASVAGAKGETLGILAI